MVKRACRGGVTPPHVEGYPAPTTKTGFYSPDADIIKRTPKGVATSFKKGNIFLIEGGVNIWVAKLSI